MATIDARYDRHLALEGAQNFRDLGGYPTEDGRRLRWRTLFRSDGLGRLTPADIEQVRELGITTVFDLRTAAELERHGTSPLFDHGVVHRHVPFVAEIGNTVPADEYTDLRTEERRTLGYMDLLDNAHDAIAEIFGALAERHHYPAVFHCAAGKDRTGMTAALVLHSLGVGDEIIASDYALTTQYLVWTDERMEAMSKEFGRTVTRENLAAEPGTIQTLFRGIEERHGSVRGLLSECGVTDAHIEAVRGHLLED